VKLELIEGPQRRKRVGRDGPVLLERHCPGYHRLGIEPGDASMVLVVTPGKCWAAAGVNEGRRLWGIAAQLYLLRSGSDWRGAAWSIATRG